MERRRRSMVAMGKRKRDAFARTNFDRRNSDANRSSPTRPSVWGAPLRLAAPHPRGRPTTSFHASSYLHELYGRPSRPPSTPAPNSSFSGGSGRYHRLVRHRVPRVRLLRGIIRPHNSIGPFRARRKVDARRVDVLAPFTFGSRACLRGRGAPRPNSLACLVVSFGG